MTQASGNASKILAHSSRVFDAIFDASLTLSSSGSPNWGSSSEKKSWIENKLNNQSFDFLRICTVFENISVLNNSKFVWSILRFCFEQIPSEIPGEWYKISSTFIWLERNEKNYHFKSMKVVVEFSIICCLNPFTFKVVKPKKLLSVSEV